jgi:glycosyl transferase, family 25
MKQIIEYFDRSYIINLVDRKDRRRDVEREFRLHGFVIPNDKVCFYGATRPTDKAGFPNIGTRGCFISHKNILELAQRDHLRNVLIFEDDVSFRSLDSSFEQKLIEQLRQKDWDMVYFGYLSPPDDHLAGPLIEWANDITGTHFYAVNGKFFGKLLEYMNKCESLPLGDPFGGPMTPDAVQNHMRYVVPNIKVLLSVPNLAHQRSSRTDVAVTGILDRIIWLRPILHRARAIKHRVWMTHDSKKVRRKLDTQSN